MKDYTPKQIVDLIFEEKLEAGFLSAMQLHKGNFSIGEIADKKFLNRDGKCFFASKMYSVNTQITDEDILAAVQNGQYISAFISRKDEKYNIHFLVHKYPSDMKARFEDEITREVVRYMVMMTVLALRLDTREKVEQYIGDAG